MTWTKLGDEYSDLNWVLSDAAYRLQNDALIWSNRKHLDGRLDKAEMRPWAKTQDPDVIAELLGRGSWEDRGDHYQIIHFMAWQRTADEWLHQSTVNSVNGRKGGRPRKRPKSEPESESVSEPESETESETESESLNGSVSEKRIGKRNEKRMESEMDWAGQDRTGRRESSPRAQKHPDTDETFNRFDYEQKIQKDINRMYDQ
jgi:hypothetical protein